MNDLLGRTVVIGTQEWFIVAVKDPLIGTLVLENEDERTKTMSEPRVRALLSRQSAAMVNDEETVAEFEERTGAPAPRRTP